MNYRDAFGDFDGRAWINCAHQGPLPLVAAEAAREAVVRKMSPHRMTTRSFSEVPARLRTLLGRLIDAEPDDVILAPGASYGLHLLANGLPLTDGDEVLLMAGDFPSDIMPWLALRDRGVGVRLVRPADHMFSAADVAAALTPGTRALCMTWVHSLSGFTADIEAIGTLCREHDVLFLANVTQALGARPLSVRQMPVDAIVCSGWKWLCGPYGTGFCWIRPDLRASLTVNQAYWLTLFTADDLGRDDLELMPPPPDHPRRFDMFTPASFFNHMPWAASLELLLDSDPASIEVWDQALVERLIFGLADSPWTVSSPREGDARSTLVFVSHRDQERNLEAHSRLAAAGVDASFRRGSLRFSPHFYNTGDDIDRALEVLLAER
jgi:selenocysteine lyase/cysteine desulfurase